MAEGYAKAKGVPGLAIATSGPGGGNLVTPIQDCFYDSTPCIFITGQVTSQFIRPDSSIRQLGFQETPIVDIVRPITKYARLLRCADDIVEFLDDAIRICKSGRPGPVLLDIPVDISKCTLTI
jgi:acetolactate synthase-1/2/3 large subunit